jgi:hypothetical protein
MLGKQLFRGAFGFYRSSVHKKNMVHHAPYLRHLVADYDPDYGIVFLFRKDHIFKKIQAVNVNGGHGFIGDDEAGFKDKRPEQGKLLLLTVRKASRLLLSTTGESHLVQVLIDEAGIWLYVSQPQGIPMSQG